MAKQWTELEKLVVPKGKYSSNTTSLHPKTGTIATITLYSPTLKGNAVVAVSPGGELFVPFFHKEMMVTVRSLTATDIPLPACKSLKVSLNVLEDEDKEFRLLALLEVD